MTEGWGWCRHPAARVPEKRQKSQLLVLYEKELSGTFHTKEPSWGGLLPE